MKRPEYEKYRYAKRRLLPVAYVDKQNEFIDHILDQNKETLEALKESLDCIVYLQDSSKVPDNEKAHYAGKVMNTIALIQEAINKIKEQ